MLRASLLANAEILPQARLRSYFFNRIGPKLPSTCPQKHTQHILLKENIEKEFE
jgi:hypothetical protein